MPKIDELGQEILSSIFIASCEDEDGAIEMDGWWTVPIDFYDPFPRRLKKVARIVRQVCRKWRLLLGFPSRFNASHFWISHASLFLNLYADEYSKSKFTQWQNTPLAKQLIRFRNILLDSSDCDIIITLAMSDSKAWAAEMEDLPRDAATMLKLFLYGMQSLEPYLRQIINFQVFASHPQILRQTLRLLADLDHGSRLRSFTLLPHLEAYEAPNHIHGPLSQLVKTGIKQIPVPFTDHSASLQITTPLDLCQIINLDTFNISNGLWLKSGILLPPSVVNMRICQKSLDESLTDVFDARWQHSLGRNLEKLIINDYSFDRDQKWSSIPADALGIQPLRNHIWLPNLRVLELVTKDKWAFRFLQYAACPRLQILDLDLKQDVDNQVTSSVFEQIDRHSSASLPLLNHAFMDIPVSIYCIAILKFLCYSGLEKLSVITRVGEPFLEMTDETVSVLRPMLSHIRLSVAKLNIGYYTTLKILPELNLERLTFLEIDGDVIYSANSSSQPALLDSFPRLETLVIKDFSLPQCATFLKYIRSDELATLVIRISPPRNPKYDIHSHIDPDSISDLEDNDGVQSNEVYGDSVRRLCACLVTDEISKLNFPSLSLAEIIFETQPVPLRYSPDEVEIMILDTLRERNDYSALPLDLANAPEFEIVDLNRDELRLPEPALRLSFGLIEPRRGRRIGPETLAITQLKCWKGGVDT